MASSDAEMVSAAVFPFIYCHLLDIYLYCFPQNTNWFNCYNLRALFVISPQYCSEVLCIFTDCYDQYILNYNMQQIKKKKFKKINT